MVVVEFKDAARERAFELVDEIKELNREKRMVVCELEDTLYDCFEDLKEEDKEEGSEEGKDLGFKSKYNRHYAMRNFEEDDEEYPMHHYRRAMRMRRNKMGRYV